MQSASASEVLIRNEEEIFQSDTNLHSIQDKVEKLEVEVGRLEREKELMGNREKYIKEIELLRQNPSKPTPLALHQRGLL